MAMCKYATLGVTTEIEILGAIRRGIHEPTKGEEILLAVRGEPMMPMMDN
jgi:hypothetical protein